MPLADPIPNPAAPSQQFRDAKQMLAALRAFFNDRSLSDDEHRVVYDVLTALRGPDAPEPSGYNGVELVHEIKLSTTAVIRQHVIGKILQERCGAFVKDDCLYGAQIRRDMDWGKPLWDITGSHFRAHARKAFAALELSWDRANPEFKE